jgi:putative MFS transporter
MADVIEARAGGRAEPPPPRRPVWAPPDVHAADQSAAIAVACAVLLVTAYGGSLASQALHFVARSFHASDADLGVALAVTRVGTLIGLVGAVLADRLGRRSMLIVSLIGTSIATGLSAFAPNLATFTALQVFVRGFVNLALIVGSIVVLEEAAEGSRAYTLALSGIAWGGGFALGAGLLPVAEIGHNAWRILFALGGLGIFLVPGIARRMRETPRYAAMQRDGTSANFDDGDSAFGPRFVLVAAAMFLTAFFIAPASQFTNRYLADERGYSAVGILLLRFVTQGPPALIAIWLGGRLAERIGRRPVAATTTLALAAAGAVFFLTGGPLLWLMLLASSFAGAMGGPSLSSFNTELFPTHTRGRAGGWLLVAAVLGSVSGLLVAGYLADPFGAVGRSVAVAAIAPAVVAIALIPRLPEARGRLLDDVSP